MRAKIPIDQNGSSKKKIDISDVRTTHQPDRDFGLETLPVKLHDACKSIAVILCIRHSALS